MWEKSKNTITSLKKTDEFSINPNFLASTTLADGKGITLTTKNVKKVIDDVRRQMRRMWEPIMTGTSIFGIPAPEWLTGKVTASQLRFAVRRLRRADEAYKKLMESKQEYNSTWLHVIKDLAEKEMGRLFDVAIQEEPDRFSKSISFRLRDPVGSDSVISSRLVEDMEPAQRMGAPDKFDGGYYDLAQEIAKKGVNDIFHHFFVWRTIAEGDVYDSVKACLELKDIEQRRVALKIYGIDKVIEETKAVLLDESDRGNMLYGIDDERIFGRPAFYLKYKDPSTERMYFSGIDPDLFRDITGGQRMMRPEFAPMEVEDYSAGSKLPPPNHFTAMREKFEYQVKTKNGSGKWEGAADRAMAWKLNIKIERYGKLKNES